MLWVGTKSGGLSRYDGSRFVTFTTADGLADNDIRCVHQDSQGHSWIGTRHAGVSCYDAGQFVNFTVADGLSDKHMSDILPDREGSIWFACGRGGMSRYNPTEIVVVSDESVHQAITLQPLFDVDENIVGAFAVITDITKHKRAEAQLRSSREQLRDLSAHLQSVREEEKIRIAREMHDELGQQLTGLKIDLWWLNERLSEVIDAGGDSPLREKIGSMSDLIDTTIQSVRRIATELRPRVLDDFGLAAAIEWEAEAFQRRTGVRCTLTCDPADITSDPDRATAIFRICQEALTNVARHANASHVNINLKQSAGNLTLEVRDNGVGLSESEISDPASLGLLGMRERALFLGGRLSISGPQGDGTTVTISIPLSQSRNQTNGERP